VFIPGYAVLQSLSPKALPNAEVAGLVLALIIRAKSSSTARRNPPIPGYGAKGSSFTPSIEGS